MQCSWFLLSHVNPLGLCVCFCQFSSALYWLLCVGESLPLGSSLHTVAPPQTTVFWKKKEVLLQRRLRMEKKTPLPWLCWMMTVYSCQKMHSSYWSIVTSYPCICLWYRNGSYTSTSVWRLWIAVWFKSVCFILEHMRLDVHMLHSCMAAVTQGNVASPYVV